MKRRDRIADDVAQADVEGAHVLVVDFKAVDRRAEEDAAAKALRVGSSSAGGDVMLE